MYPVKCPTAERESFVQCERAYKVSLTKLLLTRVAIVLGGLKTIATLVNYTCKSFIKGLFTWRWGTPDR